MKSEISGGSMHDEFLEYHRKIEWAFCVISKEAWITVILQVFKIYVFSYVNTRHFRGILGVEKDETSLPWPTLSKGNIFTNSELILLRWASYHVYKRTGQMRRLTNFTEDFVDSSALAHLLISHVPELEESHFAYFNLTCATDSDRETNAYMVKDALSLIYGSNCVNFPVDCLIRGESSLEVMLLLLFLYQTLPSFIPRAKIDFHGCLLEKVTRFIEIANPSNRPLSYVVKLEGSSEFALGDVTTINLPPKGHEKVPVQFFSRFSRPASGRLKLVTKKLGLNVSSILIFDLYGTVEPPAPIRSLKVDAYMYCTPPTIIDVEVFNPFAQGGKFRITMTQHKKRAPLLMYHKNKTMTELISAEETFAGHGSCPPAFRCTSQEIALQPNQATFLPAGQHEAVLHFVNEDVGEFMYQIEGTTLAPQSTEFAWTCKAMGTLEKSIRITPANTLREKALYAVIQGRSLVKFRPGGKVKVKDYQSIPDREMYQLPKAPLRYKPSNDVEKDKKNMFAVEQNYSELPVVFSPTLPGKYSCKIVLNCLDAPDVRLFSIHGVAISEGSKADLDFAIPARQAVTQDIPIVNKSDDEWTLKASLMGQFFTGPPSLSAKPCSTTMYPITFQPNRTCEVQGQLLLSNLQTGQKFVYNLHGIGQEPLPEDNRAIECNARDIINETFRVYNYTDRDAEYDVVTDISDVNCERRIFIPSNKYVDHNIEIRAKKVGVAQQLVTYVNRNDQTYVWFTLQMVVHPPPCEEKIYLSSVVREAVATEITLCNPLDRQLIYNVIIEGEGLFGEREITLKAGEEKNYELRYAPILRDNSIGRLVFENDTIGQFWYELHMEAKDAPPVTLPEFRAPLGKYAAQSIFISNPINESVNAEALISNSREFQFYYPPVPSLRGLTRKIHSNDVLHISLKPLERAELQIVYWPSSLTELQTAVVHITSSSIGNSTYNLQGRGQLPEPMDETIVRSTLNKSTTTVLSFTNPLIDPIPVTITISEEDSPESTGREFNLMMHRKTKTHIGGLDTLDIPISYTPRYMVGKAASVTIQTGKLKWYFPIMGYPDAPSLPATQSLDCRSRDTLNTVITTTLTNFTPGKETDGLDIPISEWVKRMQCDIEENRNEKPIGIHRILNVSIKDVRITRDKCEMDLMVIFTPIKAFEITVMLVITQKSTGARWKIPLHLAAQAPLVDDVIIIEGAINKISAVSFQLRNPFTSERKFKAFFSRESPGGEFMVAPTEGVLYPDDERRDDDNQFVVGYKASSYGKPVIATLIIECDDISWTYEVKGVTPRTVPPSAESRYSLSAISLPRITQTKKPKGKPARRNFLRENAAPVLPNSLIKI
ncbi:Cilia- and flagella-associated protein 47 [Blyttiomyces sp. JEL0837]|nr:Cilia- and flagella-associated protein 47 [Blyttiomyces sp. JEL0837]